MNVASPRYHFWRQGSLARTEIAARPPLWLGVDAGTCCGSALLSHRPILGQWNGCIKREQTWSILTLCIWIFLIIRGRRFAHNGLVGGSSPPGPTILACSSFALNGLAPKLSSKIPMLDRNLFTIRPQRAFSSPRVPCAFGRRPWYSAGSRRAMRAP
jgi:hypothetical protein